MPVISIAQLLEKFGPGDAPRSDDYIDLIDTLADDRNAVYFDSVEPTDTDANPLWFNTSTNSLLIYSGDQWNSIQGGGGASINALSPLSYDSISGDFSIDLSSYDTSSEVDTKLSNYDTSSEVDTKLSNYDTSSEVNTKLSNYDTSSEVDTKLSSYDTSSEVNSKILDIEEAMIVAITDEVSEVTTGSSKVSFRFPFDATLYQNPRASLSTASNANTVVDINKNGSSILSTKLSIDSSEKTSVSASSSAVLSTTSINSDDELTFDVDSTGNNGIGLKVTIFYKRV